MSLSVEHNQNFFAGYQEWDSIKIIYIIFHALLTFIVPSLLYSIYWYERYSPDLQYRMASNILLSHTCWIGILRCFLTRIPAVFIFVGGPFSFPLCDVVYILGRFSFVIFFNEVAIWQLVRFVFIAKRTKLIINEDNLIAFYLTLCNIVLTVTFMVYVEMLSFRVTEIDYHICTGVDPYQTIFNLRDMPWFDKDMDLSPQFNKLVYTDPVGKLFRREFLLVLLFAIVSFYITNKERVRKMFCIFMVRYHKICENSSNDCNSYIENLKCFNLV
jgi:hypothetical protein